ncbi:MAG: golgi reassembly stacking [Lasallia pustulata]|uniref:Golgi reassembly stacking n=1 Tax=Lasallia pustulata TaxID=136370 RepID=A0A5M8PVB5_9LECA|nr:MAG: golgi reassembly stacking [Lasallia pustulata]
MFGALNRFISRLDSDLPSPSSNGTRGAFGFQVLRNKNPEIPIEPWYDFIVGINGRHIDDPDPTLFATEVHNCAGSTVTLTLWSAKVPSPPLPSPLTPLNPPISPGPPHPHPPLAVPFPPLLGLTLQWTPLTLTENIWHILDVIPSSPADAAGLLPYGDYIIGTPEGLMHGEAGLGELVEDHLSRPLRLNEEARPPSATHSHAHAPSSSPTPLSARPPSRPRSSDLLVPAAMVSPPPPPLTTPLPALPRSVRKARHPISPDRAFDEYFKEGEQKSKEEDFAPSAKAAAGMAPPPKAGGGLTKARSPGPEEEAGGDS